MTMYTPAPLLSDEFMTAARARSAGYQPLKERGVAILLLAYGEAKGAASVVIIAQFLVPVLKASLNFYHF